MSAKRVTFMLVAAMVLLTVFGRVAAGEVTEGAAGETTMQRGIVVSYQQGFDKCEIPILSQLQTWWTSSPYYDINIYIGGSNRACSNSGLNNSWIVSAHSQGWNFIPTWVGPQAPCAGYGSSISWDVGTAFTQGRSEADAAHNAAAALGITGGRKRTIVYYDVEAYNTGDAACNAAVESFISGWSQRMRERGNRAGAYGSACGSDVTGWSTVANVPDDVWIAYWNYSSYSPDATVWGMPCVSDSLWAFDQRIHQYTGGHNETWGGVTFNIDSDIAGGHVAGAHVWSAGEGAPEMATGDAAGEPATMPAFDGAVDKVYIEFIDAQNGWVVGKLPTGSNFSRGVLYQTTDGGRTWMERAIPIGEPVRFVNGSVGWTAGGAGGNELYRTTDGGRNWEAITVVTSEEAAGSHFYYDLPTFFSEAEGILPVTVADAVEPRVVFYSTQDGGQTWVEAAAVGLDAHAVPGMKAPVSVIDDAHWIVGVPGTATIAVTADGGQSFGIIQGPVGGSIVGVAFTSPEQGQVTMAAGSCSGEKGTAAFTCRWQMTTWETADGGHTWVEAK